MLQKNTERQKEIQRKFCGRGGGGTTSPSPQYAHLNGWQEEWPRSWGFSPRAWHMFTPTCKDAETAPEVVGACIFEQHPHAALENCEIYKLPDWVVCWLWLDMVAGAGEGGGIWIPARSSLWVYLSKANGVAQRGGSCNNKPGKPGKQPFSVYLFALPRWWTRNVVANGICSVFGNSFNCLGGAWLLQDSAWSLRTTDNSDNSNKLKTEIAAPKTILKQINHKSWFTETARLQMA